MKIRTSLIVIGLLAAPEAHAQQWLVDNAIQNQITETSICDSALKTHEKLPDICAKYPKYGMSGGTAKGRSSPGGAQAATGAALTFTPVAGDQSLQRFADSVGATAEEKQQLGQIVQAGKAVFETKYAAKGWTNNLAGAYAFFIIATATVETGVEPDAGAQDRLFDALSSTLAQTPEVAKASAKDKTALYNMLIAGGGLPLIVFMDGQQQGNAAERQQAKALAAQFSRTLMNSESATLVGLVNPSSVQR